MKKEHGDLPDECRRYFIIRTIIDLQIHDVVETSERLIAAAGVQSADDVRRHAKPLVQYSPERRELNLELRDYLYKNLYYNPRRQRAATRAPSKCCETCSIIIWRIRRKSANSARQRMRKAGLHRAVCDYLAGMTDRYVDSEHERIFGGKFKVA